MENKKKKKKKLVSASPCDFLQIFFSLCMDGGVTA